MEKQDTDPSNESSSLDMSDFLATLTSKSPDEVVISLQDKSQAIVIRVLESLNPAVAQDVLAKFPEDSLKAIMDAAADELRIQWERNGRFGENTVGRMMEPPRAVYSPDTTIEKATEDLRLLSKHAFITYLWVIDSEYRLTGVVVMREMLLTEDKTTRLDEIMIKNPFHLDPEMTLSSAMRETAIRHFPVYPVCDGMGKLIGLVRGQMLFEAQAFELSAQPGSMVGVEREERLGTPWLRSLKFRHPWLQVNLLTAFVAAAVVGVFADTLERIVLLAVFLPVLAGQSGNTGCQALAVALRGMTLGELKSGKEKILIMKEGLLGVCNGALVGITAGLGMLVYASMQGNASAVALAFIVFVAMTASCLISGIAGAVIPLVLKRLGADPATASSIFLTTATDVASMGIFLGLATLML
jgi:magnesium transporter